MRISFSVPDTVKPVQVLGGQRFVGLLLKVIMVKKIRKSSQLRMMR